MTASKWEGMARENAIIVAPYGSKLYGLNMEGTSDDDQMGVCVESLPASCGFSEFEQFELRTGHKLERTGPGDKELKIYGLKKFLRLALDGNPDVLPLLFVKDEACSVLTGVGKGLKALAPLIVSKQAGPRFLGYMESQRRRLLGEQGQKRSNRPELESAFGYDTKYAYHILRLGIQGKELMDTGEMTLPMPEADRKLIMEVREGKCDIDCFLNRAGEVKRALQDAMDSSYLPEHPNRELVEEWMLDTYYDTWRQCECSGYNYGKTHHTTS